MVRDRVYGCDLPFLAWVRQCGKTGELPSSGPHVGIGVTDIDCDIHRYKHVVDSCGTRTLQSMIEIEAKSRGGKPPGSQQDTKFKKHEIMCRVHTFKAGKLAGQVVRHWGVAFVSCSGETPDESECIEWGRFQKDGSIYWREVTRGNLIRLLRFDLHPDNLSTTPFRRHHATREITVTETSPLGITYERKVINRS